jgi:type I restriction enzyme M protein
MAIKKSELYSSLWASCDELRGGMDASQYKDYVLVMLFLKYISDKWAGQPYAPITIPPGASFKDMVALKGKTDIGDQINKKIVGPIAEANKLADMPDFNDVAKLGSGKEMVDRLTNLIAIFEKPELNFSKNQAEGDDILGDAYEYLMRHFATESGKSKGQFYTPAEVSRIMAKIIGINKAETSGDTTVYDPACGSGSLLLKVSGEANGKVTLYGQEKDSATSGLARMNMILHDYPTAEIKQGNTLANPLFLNEDNNLKTFDFVVANPPFSDKRWSNGLTLPEDYPYNRFSDYGVPPEKNGDYAFLLHIVRSLKRHGKGAVILPHGVLFRGNAEAEIRKNLIKKGYIKGIIGLPANLFYGTGIPAAIIVIDKENARDRKGIFMIDAGKGFVKDGNKNRLREQDIHKVADVFNAQKEIPGYSKMISLEAIEANVFNLNIPRYIESQDKEDIQDLEAHLSGGIPNNDIEALQKFWDVYPKLKTTLFTPLRTNYSELTVPVEKIKDTIFEHSEFTAFREEMDLLFSNWRKKTTQTLKALNPGFKPKTLIHDISENLLEQYRNASLVDAYDMYQHLMSYWFEVMQDDCYLITQEGWQAKTHRIVVEGKGKSKKQVDKGWGCDLIPKELVIERFFKPKKNALEILQSEKESIASDLTELEEEHSDEEGVFGEMDKVNKANINARLKELKAERNCSVSLSAVEDRTAYENQIAAEPDANYEISPDQETQILTQYLKLLDKQTAVNKKIKEAEAALDKKLYAQYPKLNESEIKTLVVEDKWMAAIESSIKDEIDHISQHLTNRIKELAERYEQTLPEIEEQLTELEKKVSGHLERMGLTV